MPFNLGQAVGYLMLDTTGFTSGFRLARTAMGQFINDSNSAETRMKGLGTAATAVGATMTKSLTLPLAGMGAAAIKVTADFDSQMSKVAAISGATGEDFDKLRDKAREMGAKTTFSATEAGEAFEYMAMAGWKTEDMLEGIDGVMNLAAAAGEDLGVTSDIVTDALTAFGLSAKDSAHFADVLAAASSNSNTNVAMLGESFKYVAPVVGSLFTQAAGGAEQASRDTALALGLMANSGIKASQAGTSLRGILTRLAKPTKESAAAMDALGVSLDDGKGNMYSLRDIMDQLRDGFTNKLRIPVEELMSSMTELDAQFEAGELTEKQYAEAQDELMNRAYGANGALKAQYAAMLGGRNALSGLLAIVNATDEDYQKLTYSIDNASQVYVKTIDGAIIPMTQALAEGKEWVEEYNGETERMAAVMRGNLSGSLTILKSALQELAISIGDILMPYVKEIVAKVQDWVNKFNSLDDSTKETIVKIGLFVAAVGPVLLILGKVFTAVGTIIGVVSKLWALLAANPVGLVIVAITALVAAFIYLWNNCEEFREFWINLWETIKDWFNRKVEEIKLTIEILKIVFQAFRDTFKQIWENIQSWFTAKVNQIKTTIEILKVAFKTLSTAIKNVVDEVKQWFNNLGENVRILWSNITTSISNFITNIITKVKNFATSMTSAAKNAFIGFKNGAIEKWNDIKTWFSEALSGLIERIKNRYESFKAAGYNLLNAFKNGMIEKWNNIKSWVTEKVNWLRDKWNSAKQWVSDLGSSGSYATGTDYILSDRIVQVHEGEAILSKEENKNRMQSSGGFMGGTIPIVLNITEKIDGMTLARNQYKYNLIVDNQHGASLVNA